MNARRIPNLAAWFDMRRGIATASASLSADVSTWTGSQATPTAQGSGYRVTADSTSSPQVTGTPTNIATHATAQPPIVYTWQFQYTSGQVAYVLVETSSTGTANNRTWFRIDGSAVVGTSGSSHSNVTISALDGSGRRTATLTVNAQSTAPVLRFRIVDGDGSTTSTGTNGLYFDVFTSATICQQTRVAAIVNRATGVAWAQETANNQPGYESAGFNGRPAIRSYVSADTVAQMIVGTEAAVVLDTDGAFGLFMAADVKAAGSVNGSLFGQGNSGIAAPGIAFGYLATTAALRCVTVDNASGTKSQTGDSVLGAHVLEYHGGTTITGRVDGGSELPNGGDVNVGTRTLNRSGLFALPRSVTTAGCNASLAELVFYKRSLSAAERAYLRRCIARKCGIPGVAA